MAVFCFERETASFARLASAASEFRSRDRSCSSKRHRNEQFSLSLSLQNCRRNSYLFSRTIFIVSLRIKKKNERERTVSGNFRGDLIYKWTPLSLVTTSYSFVLFVALRSGSQEDYTVSKSVSPCGSFKGVPKTVSSCLNSSLMGNRSHWSLQTISLQSIQFSPQGFRS